MLINYVGNVKIIIMAQILSYSAGYESSTTIGHIVSCNFSYLFEINGSEIQDL